MFVEVEEREVVEEGAASMGGCVGFDSAVVVDRFDEFRCFIRDS